MVVLQVAVMEVELEAAMVAGMAEETGEAEVAARGVVRAGVAGRVEAVGEAAVQGEVTVVAVVKKEAVVTVAVVKEEGVRVEGSTETAAVEAMVQETEMGAVEKAPAVSARVVVEDLAVATVAAEQKVV